jgi:sterol desaturase/sphingolipid hydroxylase (fatty acid hydroxylase superfamily)
MVAVEARELRRAGLERPAASEVLSNLGCGLLRAGVALAIGGTLAAAYHAVHQRFALVELRADRASTWLLAFLGYDFLYYWAHRLSHRVPLLWAGHAIHHEAADFNLTVLVRAGAIAPLQVFPCYLPLALLGIPTPVYLAVALSVHALMFGLHTRLVGNLGVLGRVLNTPSHHRVHHSARPEHFGRNLGGVLIVWDRLFGTFQAESPALTRFGLASRPLIACPIRANLEPFRALLRQLFDARGTADKLRVLFQ